MILIKLQYIQLLFSEVIISYLMENTHSYKKKFCLFLKYKQFALLLKAMNKDDLRNLLIFEVTMSVVNLAFLSPPTSTDK